MPKRSSAPWLVTIVVLAACSQSGSDGGMDRQSRIKFDQYLAEGQKLYTQHCANCHQENGAGFAQLYPPLAQSDYLLKDIPKAACIIKYGQSEEIVVNGRTFNQVMPALPHLTNLEIAEILTYVTNSWGNEAGLQSVKQVDTWLSDCEEE